MNGKNIKPMLFVWIPMGLASGVGLADMAWVYHLLVILAAGFILHGLFARNR